MNGINNQLINSWIAQDSNGAISAIFGESPDFFANSPQEVFQEPALQEGPEILDFPLHQDEVEVAHLQETQDVNTAKSSSQELAQKHKKVWTQEERKQFIKLKQQQPKLSWQEFAEYFPGKTSEQCSTQWYSVLAPRLYQQGTLTDAKAEQIIDLMAVQKKAEWTYEEDKRLIELKQQCPNLPWKEFAKHFPKYTSVQYKHRWNRILKISLPKKRKLTTPDEDIDVIKRLSKRSRTEFPSPAIPATFSGENPHPLTNSSPPIPQKSVGIAIPSLSHALPIQKTFRNEQETLLDLSFYHYEGAVHHFQAIQLTNPLLQSIQQEAAKSLANAQMTYQVIKQRITTETNCILILEQAKSLISFCRTNTYYFETIYQHFISYQTSQESKEWFSSQSEEFANLYFAFLKGNMDEGKFRFLISLKERDYCHQKLNNLSIHLQDVLKTYYSCFSLEYNKFIESLFYSIKFQLNLLKDNQENWKSTVSSLEEILSRLQEIEVFFQSCSDPIPASETEVNILARLKNEISLQDFYIKQAALMTVQQEGKQAEDSLPLHEPSQTPSQPQEDFFSDPLFSPLSDQKH